MDRIDDYIEREEGQIYKDYEEGRISISEMQRELRELYRNVEDG